MLESRLVGDHEQDHRHHHPEEYSQENALPYADQQNQQHHEIVRRRQLSSDLPPPSPQKINSQIDEKAAQEEHRKHGDETDPGDSREHEADDTNASRQTAVSAQTGGKGRIRQALNPGTAADQAAGHVRDPGHLQLAIRLDLPIDGDLDRGNIQQEQDGGQHRNRRDAARLCRDGRPVRGEQVTEVEAQQ